MIWGITLGVTRRLMCCNTSTHEAYGLPIHLKNPVFLIIRFATTKYIIHAKAVVITDI